MNLHGLLVLHATSVGGDGEGDGGGGGGGIGDGWRGETLNEASETVSIVNGPQSVASVPLPQRCVTWPGPRVMNIDSKSGVEGRPSWHRPSAAYGHESSPG